MAHSSLGTSTATVPRPGIGPTIRTLAALRASARSSARLTTCATFTPAAGSNSYEVMIGPGLTCTMRPSTSKSASLRRRISALSCSSSRVALSSALDGACSRPTAGSWKAAAPPVPKWNVSCHASPVSISVLFARAGSTMVGSGSSTVSVDASAMSGGGVSALVVASGAKARRLRRVTSRAVTSRVSAAYDVCVTSSAPTGTAVSNSSQAPASPTVACSTTAAAHPVKPPACSMPPCVRLVLASVSVPCCSRPVAASSSKSKPTIGTQPRAASGRTNAATPQKAAASGKRNAA